MAETLAIGDIFTAEVVGPGRLRFEDVVQRGGWRTELFMLPPGALDRPPMQRVLKRVMDCGGQWECVFGGCLVICLPAGVDWDPATEISG